jgi:transposase
MRSYDEDFKRHAVELTLNSGASNAQIARDLGIPDTCLGAWKRKHLSKLDEASAEADGLSPSELAKENERLRRENSRLMEQRDILKKALNIIGEAPRR